MAIHTNKTERGTEIVLVTDDINEGVFDWTAGRGYLLANITPRTPERAIAVFTLLCTKYEDEILKLERALWTVPAKERMKPSNNLERFMKPLFKSAGIIDS